MKNPCKDKLKRFAHVTLIMQESHGIANKLESMAATAKKQGIPIDFYWLTRSGNFKNQHCSALQIVHLGKGNPFKIRHRQATETTKLLGNYDGLIMRYPLWDPVLAFFLRHTERIVLEHHTMEIEELNHQDDSRRLTEKLFGSRWINRFGGLIGVTPEIAAYEKMRAGFQGRTAFIPNSICIDLDTVPPISVAPSEQNTTLRMVMSASYFSAWHGLDTILDSLENDPDKNWELHLAGQLPEELLLKISRLTQVVFHGHLEKNALQKLYEFCHVGISSFNLERKGLTQATTLKVREYLSVGLPVVLGHDDPGLPDQFPYSLTQKHFDLAEIKYFTHNISHHKRLNVAHAAIPYIDSKPILDMLYNFCCTSIKHH